MFDVFISPMLLGAMQYEMGNVGYSLHCFVELANIAGTLALLVHPFSTFSHFK